MVALSSTSVPVPLVDAVPEFLAAQALDPVTTGFLIPGLEYQLWLDGRPKRIPVGAIPTTRNSVASWCGSSI